MNICYEDFLFLFLFLKLFSLVTPCSHRGHRAPLLRPSALTMPGSRATCLERGMCTLGIIAAGASGRPRFESQLGTTEVRLFPPQTGVPRKKGRRAASSVSPSGGWEGYGGAPLVYSYPGGGHHRKASFSSWHYPLDARPPRRRGSPSCPQDAPPRFARPPHRPLSRPGVRGWGMGSGHLRAGSREGSSSAAQERGCLPPATSRRPRHREASGRWSPQFSAPRPSPAPPAWGGGRAGPRAPALPASEPLFEGAPHPP